MTVRYYDHTSGRYLEGESIFSGKELPKRPEPIALVYSPWRNSGSLVGLDRPSRQELSEFPTFAETRGRGRYKLSKHPKKPGTAHAIAWTPEQIAGILRDRHALSGRQLAKKYGCHSDTIYRMLRKWKAEAKRTS